MPTGTLTAGVRPGWRRGWPEAMVGLLAAVIFLGCLGSVDLWGKREQRASAEVLDTVAHHHWLVAEIQGRPRLEKPPLPRWTTAALMLLTGRRDEWVIRLPGAACALGTVALVYLLGRRLGGRAVGLSSALILCSTGLFVGEMRQAGNDGPLAFFTTLALYAAWRVLDDGEAAGAPAPRAGGPRSWRLAFHAALGLGFLCKGPIILVVTSAAIVPYLIQAGRLRPGLRRLADAGGLLIFIATAMSWPAAVAWHDPNAPGVWMTEMSEKTGLLGMLEHRRYSLLAGYWPEMTFPWSIVAMAALILPFLPRESASGGESCGRGGAGAVSPVCFAWWWAVGNMGIFCLWSVAKPYYYLPCAPAMAVLAGDAWVRLARRARGTSPGRAQRIARLTLQAQWVLLFVGAALFPVVLGAAVPAPIWAWTIAPAVALAAGVFVSARAWRRGSDAMALSPVVAAVGVGVVVVYGLLAPAENPRRSHRGLADRLGRLVPADARTIHFYNEVDEGLWFYLRGLDLAPVPGTHPRYSTAYDLAAAFQARRHADETLEILDARREELEKQALLRWLDARGPTSFLLIRSSLYDRYAGELSRRVSPILRESGLGRNELVLLRTDPRTPVASAGPSTRR